MGVSCCIAPFVTVQYFTTFFRAFYSSDGPSVIATSNATLCCGRRTPNRSLLAGVRPLCFLSAKISESTAFFRHTGEKLSSTLETHLFWRSVLTKIYRVLPVPGRSSASGSRSNRVFLWQGDHPPVDHRCADGKITSVIFRPRRRLATLSCRVTSVPSLKANYKMKRSPAQTNNDVDKLKKR